MNDLINAKRHAEAALATGNNNYGRIEVNAEQLRLLVDALPAPVVHVVEWEGLMDAERVRQVEHGFDDAHDARQGIAQLLSWAIDYGRRGKPVAAATMTRCAFRMTSVMLHDLIDSLSHVDESTDPVLLAARVIARLQGNPNWESVEVAR